VHHLHFEALHATREASARHRRPFSIYQETGQRLAAYVGHTEIGRNGLLGDSAREVDFTCADGIWADGARM
jgi:hypothetical protein